MLSALWSPHQKFTVVINTTSLPAVVSVYIMYFAYTVRSSTLNIVETILEKAVNSGNIRRFCPSMAREFLVPADNVMHEVAGQSRGGHCWVSWGGWAT